MRSDTIKSAHNLTKRSVTETLLHMAIPMLAATFAMNAYNPTDTWFVSCLGTTQLAAMAFTFPVVMILRLVTMGIGTGALAIIAHAIGSSYFWSLLWGLNGVFSARLITEAIAAIISIFVSRYVILRVKKASTGAKRPKWKKIRLKAGRTMARHN